MAQPDMLLDILEQTAPTVIVAIATLVLAARFTRWLWSRLAASVGSLTVGGVTITFAKATRGIERQVGDVYYRLAALESFIKSELKQSYRAEKYTKAHEALSDRDRKRLTILWLDDHPEHVVFEVERLMEWGHRVHQCASPKTARGHWSRRRDPIDLIIVGSTQVDAHAHAHARAGDGDERDVGVELIHDIIVERGDAERARPGFLVFTRYDRVRVVQERIDAMAEQLECEGHDCVDALHGCVVSSPVELFPKIASHLDGGDDRFVAGDAYESEFVDEADAVPRRGGVNRINAKPGLCDSVRLRLTFVGGRGWRGVEAVWSSA